MRTWPWFKLYGRVKPLLKAGKDAEELEKLNEKIKELEANLERTEKLRAQLEEQNTKLIGEKNDLFLQYQAEKDAVAESEMKSQKLATLKENLEKQLGVSSQWLLYIFSATVCSCSIKATVCKLQYTVKGYSIQATVHIL